MAEYPIRHILATKITRLLRPRLPLDTSLDATVSSTLNNVSAPSPTLCANDLADESSSFEDMLTFPTRFGYFFPYFVGRCMWDRDSRECSA